MALGIISHYLYYLQFDSKAARNEPLSGERFLPMSINKKRRKMNMQKHTSH